MADKEKNANPYESYDWCMEQLDKAQEVDNDTREQAREDQLFVEAYDGQWEPEIVARSTGKPRYTFDMVDPLIDLVAGDIEKKDFDIRVTPGTGEATKDTAEIYDGLIRNIENISHATDTYNRATRSAIKTGFDGWEVTQDYAEGDTFDQDLIIKRIGNWLDRVWFGPHEQPDASDAKYAWKLTGIDPEVFKRKYPDRAEMSVDTDRSSHAFFQRNDLVMIGKFYYLEEESRQLVRMTDGRTFEKNADFLKIQDDLAEADITIDQERTRKILVLKTRLFDGSGWIEDSPADTVFRNWIPLVPLYANFDVAENKVLYRGLVRKQKDPQRVLNYSLSREIEEGALAPREKIWMTPEQTKGHRDTLSKLNTSADPLQHYNHVEGQPPPTRDGGATINPGLRNITESMQGIIAQSTGMFEATRGDTPGFMQSGKAIEALDDRSDTGNNKYEEARKRSQTHTARILVDAIPRVYTPGRQLRLLKEDGSPEMHKLGVDVIDQQTGELVTLNELEQGTYDVTCSAGPSFKNRQSETVAALTQIGQHDPSVIQLGKDVILKNIAAPGVDMIADRARKELFEAGKIPVDQMNEEELALYQQMQMQPPQESPEMVLARAEEQKGVADRIKAETDKAKVVADAQHGAKKLEIEAENAKTNRIKAMIEQKKAEADIEAKRASAAKDIADAAAQEIENDAVRSGMMRLLRSFPGMGGGPN